MTLLDSTHSSRRKLSILALTPYGLIILIVALFWFFAVSDVEISQRETSVDIPYSVLTKTEE